MTTYSVSLQPNHGQLTCLKAVSPLEKKEYMSFSIQQFNVKRDMHFLLVDFQMKSDRYFKGGYYYVQYFSEAWSSQKLYLKEVDLSVLRIKILYKLSTEGNLCLIISLL